MTPATIRPGQSIYTAIMVNNQPIKCFVDPGAQLTVIDINWALEHGIKPAHKQMISLTDWKDTTVMENVIVSKPVLFASGHLIHTAACILRPNPTMIISLGSYINLKLRITIT